MRPNAQRIDRAIEQDRLKEQAAALRRQELAHAATLLKKPAIQAERDARQMLSVLRIDDAGNDV